MIKLFHNIRKSFIQEGKTLNYLKYAIGEIVLVVIGILIALQVNNWNEDRKGEKFEHEILTLIDKNLEQDSIALSNELAKSELGIHCTDRLLEQVALKNYNDSLSFWMGKIITFERFRSQSSAYEMLKSKGLENISDKKLQMALISYYDQSLFNVYQAFNDVEQQFNLDWVPIIKQEFKDFKWTVYCKPTDPKTFFEKASTISFFKLYRDNRRGSVRNASKALAKISEIRTLIKKDN
ncbi:DUF6090 family protein [Gaetbulibacter aestuarii]|uniref:DUF6090 family protein n=1 Tax=Gaetbulibacter aestuarii TaxID=1502358 RepID=A0ABW7MV28_9FLAO